MSSRGMKLFLMPHDGTCYQFCRQYPPGGVVVERS